jgi:hypothetical protein
MTEATNPVYILDNSPIVTQENCLIVGGRLYERLYNHPEDLRYRVFSSTDDYDYVVDTDDVSRLDRVFANHLIGAHSQADTSSPIDLEDDAC